MFQTMYLTEGALNQYDVTPEGDRTVVDWEITVETSAPLTLVLNWTAELTRMKLTRGGQ
jgi:hypothetical protein